MRLSRAATTTALVALAVVATVVVQAVGGSTPARSHRADSRQLEPPAALTRVCWGCGGPGQDLVVIRTVTPEPADETSRAVSVWWAGHAPDEDCGGDAGCRYIDVRADGLASGSYVATFFDNHPDQGLWLSETLHVGRDRLGALVDQAWFGYRGAKDRVWVQVAGVRSNELVS